MSSRRRTLPALAPAALALLALAGCGGGGAPSADLTRTATVTRTVTVPATTPTGATASTTGTTAAPPDPSAPLPLHAAEQLLDAHGYATLSERDWRPDQPLKVLIGVRRGSGPRAELAFFFVGATYIGTDATAPSGQLAVAAQGDRSVTLDYGLYEPSDPDDAPSGPTEAIAFVWTGTKLVPQAPIPPAARAVPDSRR